MDKYAFEAAKTAFDTSAIESDYKSLYNDRQKFTDYFSINRIRNMTIDDYVLGKDKKNIHNFCYAVEWMFTRLGNIKGATAIKFGLYYDKKNNEYKHAKRFGDTTAEAFDVIKQNIISLIKAGQINDVESIIDNPISPMFKGKILNLYYPEKYLNIFAEKHVDHYLTELGCDIPGSNKLDVVEKRQLLLEFKNSDTVMKDWSVNAFAVFLWRDYPKPPNKFKDENDDEFTLLDRVDFVDLDYIVNKSKSKVGKGYKKVDYEAKQRTAKRLGNRGEKIVLSAEKAWLNEHGIKKKPKYIAETDDTKGYDIQSWFEDGSPKYIEVKSTRSSIGENSFFLSSNEYNTAVELGESYCIYLVLEVTSANPKIVRLGNPFIEKIKKADLVPITYRVDIKTLK